MLRRNIGIVLCCISAIYSFSATAQTATEESKTATSFGSQVFFRGAYSRLRHSRGNEVFTDTATGGNSNKTGLGIAAGIDLALTKQNQILDNITLIGEVFAEYVRYSNAKVLQTTSALLAGTNKSNVSVSEMNVTIAPKVRIDSLGKIRPFIVPCGLSWLVNSPPSNDTTYLDLGIPFAAGVDIVLIDQLSVGVDFRYTYALNHSNTENSYYSAGGYAAINF